MKDLLPLTGSTADPDSVAITRQKNMEFHMIAINASRRWTLINLLKSLLSFNNLFYLLSTTDEKLRVKNGEKNIAEHEALVEALEKRDPGLAKDLVITHIQSAKEDRISLHPERNSH
jgi:DNA-binding GntR family transcriptional regulator